MRIPLLGGSLCPILALSRVLSPPRARSSSAVRLERRLRLRFSLASTRAAVRSTSLLRMRPATTMRSCLSGIPSDHKARLAPLVRRALPEPLVRRDPSGLRARQDQLDPRPAGPTGPAGPAGPQGPAGPGGSQGEPGGVLAQAGFGCRGQTFEVPPAPVIFARTTVSSWSGIRAV